MKAHGRSSCSDELCWLAAVGTELSERRAQAVQARHRLETRGICAEAAAFYGLLLGGLLQDLQLGLNLGFGLGLRFGLGLGFRLGLRCSLGLGFCLCLGLGFGLGLGTGLGLGPLLGLIIFLEGV